MAQDTRTLAGAVLDCIIAETRRGSLQRIPGTMVEGAQDTASVWMTGAGDRIYQVHVTELHPTEDELAGAKRCGR